jgi:hypothetical protein
MSKTNALAVADVSQRQHKYQKKLEQENRNNADNSQGMMEGAVGCSDSFLEFASSTAKQAINAAKKTTTKTTAKTTAKAKATTQATTQGTAGLFMQQIQSEDEQSRRLYTQILEDKVVADRKLIAEQSQRIKILEKISLKTCAKKDSVIAELRHNNAIKQQQTRRQKKSLASIKTQVKSYLSSKGKNIGIDILSLSEAQKWAAMCALAKERIEKETEGARDMTAEDRSEMKETLIELFEAANKNLGRFNKAGDKRGIQTQIRPRVLAAAQQLCSGMSAANYEKARLTHRNLPSYSTLKKYNAEVSGGRW